MTSPAELEHYWSIPPAALLTRLGSSPTGLTTAEAQRRLTIYGPNTLTLTQQATALRLLLAQFKNPLLLILVVAAGVSAFVREWIDAGIVLTVIIGSVGLGFFQEYSAMRAMEKLRARMRLKTTVLRAGQTQSIAAETVVPGDLVLLSAGSLIPADGVVLEAQDFFVNQAVLTGETFPAEKSATATAGKASLAERTNCVFMGTSARSGTAHMLVIQTGKATLFGQLAERLTLRPPETEFERGVRRFGYLLTQVMLVLVLIVFAANVFVAKPAIDALLFSIALAVGLAPELLPAIISLTLARGAQRMAQQGVIVRRLTAIENIGSMDVLCTDKTGTLTLGVVKLDGALNLVGQPAPEVLRWACLNAQLQTGLANPLDEALVAAAKEHQLDLAAFSKVAEVPYDFVRKRLTVVVQHAAERQLITKGALENVLAVCTQILEGGAAVPLAAQHQQTLQQHYAAWSGKGFRVLGLAIKNVPEAARTFTRADERDLTFAGFLLFFDPPKPGMKQTLADLAQLGVTLKIITGDNHLVAKHLAEQVGLKIEGVLNGAEIADLRDEALWHQAERTTLFTEVDPNEKERIILALRKLGHVVGYMGDGINDAPALHAADVGISVDSAVDVAKEAADFVLLEHNLDVLRQGVEEGRRTFANTLKYIFTTTSANFGNMFSMAGASIFLPFLPLLAKQILLNNFLSDIPGMTIADDNVDRDWIERPHRWDIGLIRNFMIVFGLVSSFFDYMTFGVLLLVVRATPAVFRTSWFIESLLTELAVALVVRTQQPFFRSRPGRWLWVSTVIMAVLTLLIPYLPFNQYLGFVPLPPALLLLVLGITGAYTVTVEFTKRIFYKRFAKAILG